MPTTWTTRVSKTWSLSMLTRRQQLRRVRQRPPEATARRKWSRCTWPWRDWRVAICTPSSLVARGITSTTTRSTRSLWPTAVRLASAPTAEGKTRTEKSIPVVGPSDKGSLRWRPSYTWTWTVSKHMCWSSRGFTEGSCDFAELHIITVHRPSPAFSHLNVENIQMCIRHIVQNVFHGYWEAVTIRCIYWYNKKIIRKTWREVYDTVLIRSFIKSAVSPRTRMPNRARSFSLFSALPYRVYNKRSNTTPIPPYH